jgi:hypothetical protein
MSPPYTTPPPQNAPKGPKGSDAIVDEPNTDPKATVKKFFGGPKNYKHKKPLENLVVSGMTIKEFWQHGNKDYTEFEYGKPLIPKHVHIKLFLIVQKIQKWYYLTCVYRLNFVEAKISVDIFNTLDFDLHIKLVKLHTIFRLKMLDITMMTVWCM